MQESSMELLWRSSHIAGGNATYVEDLYESYLKDPNMDPIEIKNPLHDTPETLQEMGCRAEALHPRRP